MSRFPVYSFMEPFTPAECRTLLIEAGLLTIFQMTEEEVAYHLGSVAFWASPLGEED